MVDGKKPGQSFLDRRRRREVINWLVSEPARERLDRGHPVATADRLSGFTVGGRSCLFGDQERRPIVVVRFSEEVALVACLLEGGCAQGLLDPPTRIETRKPFGDAAVIPPYPASLLEVRIVFDAFHGAVHWSTIWSQFGPQIPAILRNEIQTDPENPFEIKCLLGVHFVRNGASDGT